MPNRKTRPTMLSSAARGALAGLIGGVVLTAAQRVVVPKLPGRSRRVRHTPDGPLETVSRRLLDRFSAGPKSGSFAALKRTAHSPRARSAATIAARLVSAAALGAAYGMAVEQLDSSRAGRSLIDAALVFGASLITPELAPTRSRQRGRAKLQRALAPLAGPAAYGRTTSAALRLLAG